MAVRVVLEFPDPRLRCLAIGVDRFDAALAELINDLTDTLHATRAIGLAAPQLGVAARVFVIDVSGNGSDTQVFVNPELLWCGEIALVEESCLSLPGVVENVTRAVRARVRAVDAAGVALERDLTGLAAVCFQHELDHLDGVLFIDALPALRRLGARWKATAGSVGLRERWRAVAAAGA